MFRQSQVRTVDYNPSELHAERALKKYFSEEQLVDIKAKFDTVRKRTDRTVLRYVYHPFQNESAAEFARHGFARRVQLLRRCIENVFKIIPPSASLVPSRDELYDAQINIQAFVTNAYGSIDNLAWIWVHESGLLSKIDRRMVGLRKHQSEVRASLSADFAMYLSKLDTWFEYLVEYRDALAHRIPLYIPPGGVRPALVDAYNALSIQMTDALNALEGEAYENLAAQQNELLVFQPLITHSVTKTAAHFAFHVQMIADFLTVEEVGEKMLAELARNGKPE
jgi:hypothetical protein